MSQDHEISLSKIHQDILDCLKLNDSTKDELVEKTGYPKTTIYDNLQYLIKKELVLMYKKKAKQKIGRPKSYYALHEKYKQGGADKIIIFNVGD